MKVQVIVFVALLVALTTSDKPKYEVDVVLNLLSNLKNGVNNEITTLQTFEESRE